MSSAAELEESEKDPAEKSRGRELFERVVSSRFVPMKIQDRLGVKDANSASEVKNSFSSYPFLRDTKPHVGYKFDSDVITVDDGSRGGKSVMSVEGYFVSEDARDALPAYWGVSRIVHSLPQGVSMVMIEHVEKMSEKWIDDARSTARKVANVESTNVNDVSKARQAAKKIGDVEVITEEIDNGAAYLHVQDRLLLKAPNVDVLDSSQARMDAALVENLGTMRVAPYHGEQNIELSNIFAKNERKRGKGFYYTSTEFAGRYSLATNGINDLTGEYLGNMIGDVNTSASVIDLNRFENHVVIAGNPIYAPFHNARFSSMWGSKVAQSVMLNGHRVVHIILDDTKLNNVGPEFETLTAKVDLNNGDVNMFEMFGHHDDELTIFATQAEKLRLMAEQAYTPTDSDRSIIANSLTKVITQFYIDMKMWHHNPKENRDRLRVVGLPHDEVPTLRTFISFIQDAYDREANKSKDQEMVHAYNVLRSTFESMLNTNGDLFDTVTSSSVDNVGQNTRVIYDFSKLNRRGRGVAMAQLVNVIGLVVDALGAGDTVIIHGAENVENGVRDFVVSQLDALVGRQGRVVYCFNAVDKMLDNAAFCGLDTADYTMMSTMTVSTWNRYRNILEQTTPEALSKQVTDQRDDVVYFRRGYETVVFQVARADLFLGLGTAADFRTQRKRRKRVRRGTHKTIASNSDVSVGTLTKDRTGKKRSAKPRTQA